MITIRFDASTAKFSPGEGISGTVSWSDLGPKTMKLETRLIWYTEGKGDQDIEIVMSLPSDVTQPDGSARFEFTAPTRPFSFSGKLISLIWAVEVVVFPEGNGYREQFTLSLDGTEIRLEESFQDTALNSSMSIGY